MQQVQEKVNKKYLLIILVVLAGVTRMLLPVILLAALWDTGKPVTEEPQPTRVLEANPYDPTDFVLDSRGYMTYAAGESVMGIDVSGFQGEIDWEAVKNAGVEFVFIRIGGRGYGEEGVLYTDDAAHTYYQGAKAAGLQVGAYFFSQALTPREAREEAWFLLKQIPDWELDLPIVYDWEWVSNTARTANMEKTMLTHSTLAFCKTVEAAGYDAMIYFNYSQGQQLLDLKQLEEYPFWLAMYDAPMDIPYKVEYWQYSCTGTVPGIKGSVDLNILLPE